MTESSVTPEHWHNLGLFRAAADYAFAKNVLPYPDKLANYDQAVATAKDAFAARGVDLDQEEQVFIVATTINWLSDFLVRLTSSQCSDPHVFEHLRAGLIWPAYVVRELTLHIDRGEGEPHATLPNL